MAQRPLAGPAIPIPANEDEQLLAEYTSWREVTAGSFAEFLVWDWLVKVKRQLPSIDFYYQYPLAGGRTAYGGWVLDFYFPQKGMGWRVMGLRWHLLKPEDRARDLMAKQILEGRGIHTVDLWEDDLLATRIGTLEKAWNGQEMRPGRTN
jgi:hypothetical protein